MIFDPQPARKDHCMRSFRKLLSPSTRGTRLLLLTVPMAVALLLAGALCPTTAYLQDDDDEIVETQAAKPRVPRIITIAGTGKAGFNGDRRAPKKTSFYWPQDILVDGAKNLYILDWNNHRVRLAPKLTDKVVTVIGSGFLGDGTTGPATKINLNHPTGLTLDSQGRLVLAAWHNWKIKRVNSDGNIEILAGTSQGFSGDGNLGPKAQMDLPSSAAYDASGNLYISDQGNRRIRRLDPSGIITTIAGTGVPGFNGDNLPADQAQLNSPRGSDAPPAFKIAVSGNTLYLADTLNHRVRAIDLIGGMISTVAGNGTPGFSGDGGPATDAQLNYPTDVAVGPDGSVFICDSLNHAVRKVNPQGIITTVAGVGSPGFKGDGKAATSARLNTPGGIYVDAEGTLYIADSLNNRIRMVK